MGNKQGGYRPARVKNRVTPPPIDVPLRFGATFELWLSGGSRSCLGIYDKHHLVAAGPLIDDPTSNEFRKSTYMALPVDRKDTAYFGRPVKNGDLVRILDIDGLTWNAKNTNTWTNGYIAPFASNTNGEMIIKINQLDTRTHAEKRSGHARLKNIQLMFDITFQAQQKNKKTTSYHPIVVIKSKSIFYNSRLQGGYLKVGNPKGDYPSRLTLRTVNIALEKHPDPQLSKKRLKQIAAAQDLQSEFTETKHIGHFMLTASRQSDINQRTGLGQLYLSDHMFFEIASFFEAPDCLRLGMCSRLTTAP